MIDLSLVSPSVVKRLLTQAGLRPKKRLGQNFLIDGNILGKIIAGAELDSHSKVLEVGPGPGTVTVEAASVASQVVAVEADRDLLPILEETTKDYSNIEVVHSDFLKLDLPEFLKERFQGEPATVVANLPYYITSPLIVKLIEAKEHINRMVIMVQEEVADRLTAKPGTKGYGSITVFVRYHCQIQLVAKAKRTVFYPAPDVDSAVLRLDILPTPAVRVDNEQLFFAIVRASFGQRRKTLLKSLSGSQDLYWSREKALAVLTKAEIDPTRRGETLSLEEFARLANS